MDSRPRGRFLTGHSSGGWATLWLQVTYPRFFGGTWSTSPDPVDFRDFTNIDLTMDRNVYTRSDGTSTRLVRMNGRDVESFEDLSRQEQVLGEYGGQISSFDWVFSPRGPDGRPMPLFDRDSGVVNREVADYWLQHYDISRILTSKARELVGDLRGKIHVIVGTADGRSRHRGRAGGNLWRLPGGLYRAWTSKKQRRSEGRLRVARGEVARTIEK
jgi:hypothetical protein